MSMEIHAILPSGVPAPSAKAWEGALAGLQVQIVFHPDFKPDKARGFCPMTIQGHEAGCEVDRDLETVDSLRDGHAALDDIAADATVFSFRYGGSMLEGACAYAAAAALMQCCGAVLYEPEVGAVSRTIEPVMATARDFLDAAD